MAEAKRQQEIKWEMTIVFIVAVKDEVIQVSGILEKRGSPWVASKYRPLKDSNIFKIYYQRKDDLLIRLLLAKIPHPHQGGDATAWATTSLVERYKPYCIVMVGICAGASSIVDLGDVVIASTTVRHDFGKLKFSSDGGCLGLGSFKLEHRGIDHKERVDASLLNSLVDFEQERKVHNRKGAFKTQLGVISTCNQVTSVPKVFDYLKKEIGRGASGDSRVLMALDMEAHAVAYAAVRSALPRWLVVKGVCDFADPQKNNGDEVKRQETAAKNAMQIAQALLSDVLVRHFLHENSEGESEGVQAELTATGAFKRGDYEGERKWAERAYQCGRRSQETRRRYLRALLNFGQYPTAHAVIDELRRTGQFLYDPVTIEYEATMLSREGKPKDAYDLLNKVDVGRQHQLMYLKAVSDVMQNRANAVSLERARGLLKEAMELADAKRPWWIAVNRYWVLMLSDAERAQTRVKKDQNAVYAKATEWLDKRIRTSQGDGTSRLYLLFLLAIADEKARFRSAIANFKSEGRNVNVGLGQVDQLYERLDLLYEKRGKSSELSRKYCDDISAWLRETRRYGQSKRVDSADGRRSRGVVDSEEPGLGK